MRIAHLLLAALLAFLPVAAQPSGIRVVDASDSLAVAGATVFSHTGAILCLTDNDGIITGVTPDAFPITVRCLGFDDLIVTAPAPQVALPPTAYPLREMVVTPTDRPVTRLICYVREYVSGGSGSRENVYYNEHMADFFLAERKLKGFKSSRSPRFISSRLFARTIDGDTDSIFQPAFRDESITWEMLISMPEASITVAHDSVPGKYCLKQTVSRSGDLAVINTDYLADTKGHSMSPMIFKLIGFTLDINQFREVVVTRLTPSRSYTAADIISSSFTFDILGRGKWIKKAFDTDSPVRMYGYYE
ncbi:MAG: carboxypeptidase-like regulatory domain-containing protein, partial [Muribaculaceae bacterium]|nr:carboxypeptidase-like regulatory domain-containing protein [Muribaculaceae bacterium]